jgi:hypothetical protein
MMHKKGQVYLLAALIIGFILFLLATQTNVVTKIMIEDDFEDLSKNYDRESANFVNSLLVNPGANVEKEFTKFTALFTSFAKTKNPEFGLVYAFLHQGTVYLGNYLDQAITIITPTPQKTVQGCYALVDTTISIAGLNFTSIGISSLGRFSSCSATFTAPPGNTIQIEIGSIDYALLLAEDSPDVMLISRETKDNQRKVFIKSNIHK